LGRDFGSDAGTVAVLKQLSVAAVMGGDSMSLQRKLLQSRPVDIDAATPGQLLQCVQADTVVKHLRYAVLGALFTMLKQGFAADFQ
jgi:superfamily II DNA/RNA helicase